MRIFKKVMLPATEAREVMKELGVSCDFCGIESNNDDNWLNESYQFERTEISYTKGSSYPGDYDVDEEISFDLCPDCFNDRLLPFMGKNMIKIKQEAKSE